MHLTCFAGWYAAQNYNPKFWFAISGIIPHLPDHVNDIRTVSFNAIADLMAIVSSLVLKWCGNGGAISSFNLKRGVRARMR
jgi:hypothetical protein